MQIPDWQVVFCVAGLPCDTYRKQSYIGLAEFRLRAFRRAKGESLGPHAQAVETTVLLLEAD